VKLLVLLLSTLLFLTSCSSPKDKELKISVNSWIGYSPLFYAYDKGWLKKHNIKVVHVVSLAESMYIYDSKNADALTGTQYEYTTLKKEAKNLTPIMMFDKSFGGDMVMSNRTTLELQESNETIDTHLELNSINSLVLAEFLKYYRIDEQKINYINQDQESISTLKNSKTKPKLIVTYVPYNIRLKKNGFKTIASTRDELAITVVDALFVTQYTLSKHEAQFKALKIETNRAIEALEKNPQEYYKHVKYYLQDISYEEFLDTLHDIKWINKTLSKELKERLQEIDFPTNGLL